MLVQAMEGGGRDRVGGKVAASGGVCIRMSGAPSFPPGHDVESDKDAWHTSTILLVVLGVLGVLLKMGIIVSLCIKPTHVTVNASCEEDRPPPGLRETITRWARWQWRHAMDTGHRVVPSLTALKP